MAQGILKYCLKDLLGEFQRKAIFMFIDVCAKLFAEKHDADSVSSLLQEVNLALAQLEKDMPVTIQVSGIATVSYS